MLRVFYPESFPDEGSVLSLPKEESHHLVRVRRARLGDAVELLDGKGGFAIARIDEVAGKRVSLRLESVSRSLVERTPVRLCLAFPKPKIFEALLAKCVELGVTDILPLATDHADPAVAKTEDASRRERWQQILVEAMKQSGNLNLPQLHETQSLDSALASAAPDRLRICAALQPGSESLWTILQQESARLRQGIDLYIGPEGDFSKPEYQRLRESCSFFTLGENVLRVETAAVSVAAIVHEALRVLPESASLE
ncbi:MAG: 16S rRNA (uracil(1498)-N(3))-methyltransferase [Opitutales bacterium]|nr:16S rRNA (uracil(1498)-N(3))-methyltransferase [Opitutales bacterium]